MIIENHKTREQLTEALTQLTNNHLDLENFYIRTMEHVDGMLLNKESLNLHPIVERNLYKIKELL